MKTLLLSLLVSVILLSAGCNQNTSGNLRPARGPNQESVMANINLAVEYMRQSSFEKAQEKLDRARQIDPGYFGVYNMYGLLYQRMGQNNEAEKNFRKALSLANNDAATLNNFGQFLCHIKKPDEAEEVFLKAVNNPLNQTPEVALTNAAICAQINQQTDKAESYFRRALEKNPKIPEVLIRMSQLSFSNNNPLSARAYMQRYLEIARHSSQTLWLAIQIEDKLGDKNSVSSNSMLLRNNFPDSVEAGLLEKSGLR